MQTDLEEKVKITTVIVGNKNASISDDFYSQPHDCID